MAKAPKKSDKSDVGDEKPMAAKKAPAKKAPAATAAAKADAPKSAKAAIKPSPKKPGAAGNLFGGSVVDSGLLASSAANFLLARAKGRHQMQAENAVSIEQIKSDLAKPASAVAGELIDQHAEGAGAKRPNLPGGGKHSQTVGHAAERTSVPRRTGG
jgi:hypothetical protein